jgi:hypothetical protein
MGTPLHARIQPLSSVVCGLVVAFGAADAARGESEIPRIDSVVMSSNQPHREHPAVIWYDDFDGPAKPYTESQGRLDSEQAFGGEGRAMLSHYDKDSRGVGNRKVFFGDSPTGKVVRRGESFADVYWRIYVKHQSGWQGGGPAKLSRATSIVTPRWAQAMISHVWSSGESLTLDPATGVRNGRVVTTKYNDFANLRWLGNKPVSQFKIHSTSEAGRWICVEARAKLNTPGKKDGLNQLWIDGRLEAERTKLDWRGTYDEYGINAVFLETYWNAGSPVTQSRWIDNFVISTQPIGPVVCPRNPTLIRTPQRTAGKPILWEAEVSADADGNQIVWKSHPIRSTLRVEVNRDNGRFLSSSSSQNQLEPGVVYFVRARQQDETGQASNWSNWHQPFKTEG